jgi:cytoskeleton protein RodZ
MSSERAEQPTTPDNQHGIPGKTLAAHREAMGWSVEQVADQLKLAVRQVVALEAGDYASLPSPAVTRGFVRAYAKLMKLDPVPLVAQIEMDVPAAADLSANTAATRRPAPASFSESRFPLHGKRSSLPLGWIAGAVVVVAAAAAAAWHFGVVPMRSSEQAAPAANGTTGATAASAPVATGVASDSANGSTVETLQNPAVPLISVPSPNSAAPAAAAAGTASAAAASAAGPVVNVPNTSATGAPPTTVPVAPASPVATQAAAVAAPAAAGANALVLNVREDSWIEVRPAKGGAPLLSRLVKGGSTETINVAGPVRLTVGNPGGVSVTLRGTAVSLPAVPGKTLARVNLQ